MRGQYTRLAFNSVIEDRKDELADAKSTIDSLANMLVEVCKFPPTSMRIAGIAAYFQQLGMHEHTDALVAFNKGK